MFEDSILESSGRLKSHCGWTTLASSALQLLFLAGLVLLPVFRPQAMPHVIARLAGPPTPYGRTEQRHGTPAPRGGRPSVIATRPGALLWSGPTPPRTSIPAEASCNGCDPGPVGPPPIGPPDGVPGSLGPLLPAPATHHVAPADRIILSTGVSAGNLVRRVDPDYPALAKMARVEGDVVLQAFISREGNIEQLQALSGHPLLVPAALDAVRQWRYRPYLLDGHPVEVETQITVHFVLSHR